MIPWWRMGQEDASMGEEEDVLKGEVLQEPLESLRVQVQGNSIYLGTNLQAEEFTPPLHNKIRAWI